MRSIMKTLLAGTGLACALSTPAYAQTAAGTDADAGSSVPADGDIIVTATRRDERLQDVPVAVTAISAAQLELQQIDNVQDLFGVVPGVNVATGVGGTNELQIGLRGLVPSVTEPTVDMSVGIYIDGVYVARPISANTGFIDMERVEVLRGPQGTLFGRNTIGGAFNITTKKPTEEFTGYVEAAYGNYDMFRGTGVVNLPLNDIVQTRFVYSHMQRNGFGRSIVSATNPLVTGPLDREFSDAKQDYARGTLRVAPSEDFEMLISGDYFRFEGNSALYRLNYVAPGSPFAAYVTNDYYQNQADFNPKTFNESYSATINVTGNMGFATIRSISAYRHAATERASDLDASPIAGRDFVSFPFSGEQISQELQLFGDAVDGRLNWIVGGYYFYEKGSYAIELDVGAPVVIVNSRIPTLSNESLSAFAQLDFAITDALKVTGGIRQVRDNRSVAYQSGNAATVGGPLIGACGLPAAVLADPANCFYHPPQASYDFTPWTAELSFQPNRDLLAYVKVSRGYRSGGFQTQAAALAAIGTESFGPENLISYEGGIKATLLDGVLVTNLAGYHSKYSGVQQNENFTFGTPAQTISIIQNAGKAEINGVEAELAARLGGFRLSATYAYTDATFTSGPSVGTPYLVTPKHTFSVAGNYSVELGRGKLGLNADYSYRSKVFFYTPLPTWNQAQIDAVSQDGYGLFNASVSYSYEPFTLTVFAKNLADKEYAARTMNFVAAGFNTEAPGEPRTYGVSLRFDF